jgi:acetamidase/formamidase
MDVKVRLTVRKDRSYTKTPHFQTLRPNASNEEHYCTTGVDSDVREATRSAVRNMINFLEAEFQMDRVAAYMLCSVAGDLRMHEVVRFFRAYWVVKKFDLNLFLSAQVDMPNYVVCFSLMSFVKFLNNWNFFFVDPT